MGELQENMDSIHPDLLRAAIEQILGVLYDHQLDDLLDRMQNPGKYGGDFHTVDLNDIATTIRLVEGEIAIRAAFAKKREKGLSS